MAKREGYTGPLTSGPSPSQVAVHPAVPPFNELAKQLDPMLPQTDYNALREKYFKDQILPNLSSPTAVTQAWADFQSQTERQPLLDGIHRIGLRVALATQKLSEGVTAPLSVIPGMDSVHQQVQSEGDELHKLAAREGVSTTIPDAIGTLTGFGLTFETAMEGFGPLAQKLASTAATSAKTVELASRALRGGMALATYEAASDQTGNRLMSGLRGFGVGASADLLLGLPAFLKGRGAVASVEEGQQVAEDLLQGKEASPEANKAAAEYLQNQEKLTKQEGRPNLFLDPNSKQKGLYAIVEGPDGQAVPFQIHPGKEDAAMNGIQKLLDKGGSLDTLQWDVDNHGRGVKFLREIADKNNLKYDSSALIRTNQPTELIKSLADKGVSAEVKPNGTVSVPVQTVDLPPALPKVPDNLPDNVSYIGQQKGADGEVVGDLYNYELPGGMKPTFMVKPGEDMAVKMEAVRKRFTAADEVTTNAAAQTTAEVAKEAGQMPKMSYQQAQLLVKRFGMDPAKADIDAIMYMGEAELNRLIETVQAQRAVRVGPEASVAEEQNRLNPLPKQSSGEINEPVVKSVQMGQTSFHGTSPENAKAILNEGLVDKYKGYMPADLIDLGHPAEDFKDLPTNQRAPFVFTTQSLGDATTYAGPEAAGEESAPRVVFELEHGKPMSEIPGELIHPELPVSAIKKLHVGTDFAQTAGGKELIALAKSKGIEVNSLDMADLVKRNPNFGGEGGERFSSSLIKGNTLSELLGYSPDQFQDLNLPVKARPGTLRAVVPRDMMSAIGGDTTEAQTYANWQAGLKELGVDRDTIEGLDYPNSPAVIFRQGVTRDVVYHEGIHANLINAGLNPLKYISKSMRSIVTDLAGGLFNYTGYDRMKFEDLVDEAFTYGAQAVRFGDEGLLRKMGNWDTSERHVISFVNDTAKNLLGASYYNLDNPGVRIFQRRLNDLIRRTDPSMFYWAQQGLEVNGEEGSLLYHPQGDTWTLGTKNGSVSGKDLNALWDRIIDNDLSDYTSDPSFWSQARGMRGGLTSGPPPGKNLPMPEQPLTNGKGFGWLAISGWFRPFLPWVSSLDSKLADVAATKGVQFPLFSRVKAVDDAVRTGDAFLTKWTERFGDELANWDHPKQTNLLNLLSYDPSDWEKAAGKLNLSADELTSAGKIAQYLKDFKEETGINGLEYLRNYFPTLKANVWQTDSVPGWGILKNVKNQGFWEKSINTGELDPSDEHAGRFLKWMIRQGYEKNFTGTPLKELQQLVDLKSNDGQFILGAARWPMENYIKYMRGIPDASAQAINRAVGDFQGFLEDRAKKLNEYLPEGLQLPEELGTPKNTLNKLMLLSYASGLALRPAVAIRDALQVFITGLPVIGGGAFAKGLTKALTREGWDFAENSGALLRKTNIGEMYGDIFNEMPLPEKGLMNSVTQLSQKLLGPSRWGNNLARASVFNGVFSDAMDALEKFKAGSIDQAQFLKDSHLWFTEPQVYSKFLSRAVQEGVSGNLAKDIALELTDSTQWAYRRGTQPAMLKTGLGRILGQYGNWPLNYAEYVTKLGRKYTTFPDKAMGAMGLWAATNFAASKAMEGIGADSSKWLWTSPASFTGGPNLDLVQDLMTAVRSDDEGASARARVMRYPLNFIPGSIATRSIISAMENNEDMSLVPPGKGLIRALGFKPLAQVNNDPDYVSYALEQSGLTANPYKGRR
jgi:hypothetical protein